MEFCELAGFRVCQSAVGDDDDDVLDLGMAAEAEGDAHGVYEALNTALSYVSHAQHARRVSGETCCARRACVSRCQERTDADLCPCGAQTTTVAGTLAAGQSIGPRVGE